MQLNTGCIMMIIFHMLLLPGQPRKLSLSVFVVKRFFKLGSINLLFLSVLIFYAQPLLNAVEIAEIKKKYGKILLFFPSHSCVEGRQLYDVEKMISRLKNICMRGGFETVFVNMYYYDILHTDYAKYYLEQDLK